MKFHHLKKSNIQLSQFCFGTGSISGAYGGYNHGTHNIEPLNLTLNKVLEYGINWIDTAPAYGFHYVEKYLGSELKKLNSKFILASKGGLAFSQGKNIRVDNSPSMLGSMLTQSLKNLQVDCLDIYFIHWPDPKVPLEESVDYLCLQRKKGLIKSIGLSNFDISQVSHNILKEIEITQNEANIIYNLLPSHELKLMHKLIISAYGLLGRGILTKTEFPSYEKIDYRFRSEGIGKMHKYFNESKNSNLTKNSATLVDSTLVKFSHIDSAIIGFKNPSHVDEFKNLYNRS